MIQYECLKEINKNYFKQIFYIMQIISVNYLNILQ